MNKRTYLYAISFHINGKPYFEPFESKIDSVFSNAETIYRDFKNNGATPYELHGAFGFTGTHHERMSAHEKASQKKEKLQFIPIMTKGRKQLQMAHYGTYDGAFDIADGTFIGAEVYPMFDYQYFKSYTELKAFLSDDLGGNVLRAINKYRLEMERVNNLDSRTTFKYGEYASAIDQLLLFTKLTGQLLDTIEEKNLIIDSTLEMLDDQKGMIENLIEKIQQK